MLFRILFLTTLTVVLTYKLETGKQYDAAQYAAKGEKGESGYSGQHQAEKGAKGHHDKENHQKQYAEEGGNKKGYHHKDGYYADHHQGEKGSKGFHYEDHGKYAKGHSTKGHHNVHKLNEFKKDTDFYDENNDQAFEEKHGGFETKKAVAKGEFKAGGYQNKGNVEGKFGVAGFAEKGANYFNDKGHKNAQGNQAFYGNHAEFAKKGTQDGFNKFGFIKVN